MNLKNKYHDIHLTLTATKRGFSQKFTKKEWEPKLTYFGGLLKSISIHVLWPSNSINCLSVFDHFVGLALKGLSEYFLAPDWISG